MLIVQASQSIKDGDGYYRLHEPIRALGLLTDLFAIDCDISHRFFWFLAETCDVLILHFFSGWLFFPLIERRRRAGKVTVFETNDYFEDLQPWNPISEPWLNPDIRREHKEYIGACDAVQTSTPRLAQHLSGAARRVAVFKNHLVTLPPLKPPPARPLTIGWAGSQGHLADWYHTTCVIEPWLIAHPDVCLSVMSNAHAKDFLNLPAERFHFRGASSIQDYYDFLETIDIGLAPLLPTEYNRCRSDVKFLEYASRGVAGVYKKLEPYSDSVQHGVTGLLYESDAEMLSCLDSLASDTEVRGRVRSQAHEYVAKNRILWDNIAERAEFYRSLLPEKPAQYSLPQEIVEAGVREGNYLRIELDNAGKLFNHTTSNDSAQKQIEVITQLVNAYPDYLFPLQTLGRLYCETRQPERAIPHLERALNIEPDNLRTLSELGRAQFLGKNFAEARKNLEKTVQLQPAFVPGWEALLRFIKYCPQDDQEQIVQHARKRHPQSYSIALLCAEFLSGIKRVEYLHEMLEFFAARLSSEQLQHAAWIFVQSIVESCCGLLDREQTRKLLQLTRKVFPNSTKISLLLGSCLKAAGLLDEASSELKRALALQRTALEYIKEFPKADESHLPALIAEHLYKLGL